MDASMTFRNSSSLSAATFGFLVWDESMMSLQISYTSEALTLTIVIHMQSCPKHIICQALFPRPRDTFRLTKTSSRETPALLIPVLLGWLLLGKRETKPVWPKVPPIFPDQIHYKMIMMFLDVLSIFHYHGSLPPIVGFADYTALRLFSPRKRDRKMMS